MSAAEFARRAVGMAVAQLVVADFGFLAFLAHRSHPRDEAWVVASFLALSSVLVVGGFALAVRCLPGGARQGDGSSSPKRPPVEAQS